MKDSSSVDNNPSTTEETLGQQVVGLIDGILKLDGSSPLGMTKVFTDVTILGRLLSEHTEEIREQVGSSIEVRIPKLRKKFSRLNHTWDAFEEVLA